jgi:hypothetical protein
MKKSKFLKKSLAMLLALMLVVAMIPLSAAAAYTPAEGLKPTTDAGTVTAVDGGWNIVFEYSTTMPTIKFETGNVDETISYIDKDQKTATNGMSGIEVWEDENGDPAPIEFWVVNGSDASEHYTITWSMKDASSDVSVKSAKIGNYTGVVNEGARTIKFTLPFGYAEKLSDDVDAEITFEGASTTSKEQTVAIDTAVGTNERKAGEVEVTVQPENDVKDITYTVIAVEEEGLTSIKIGDYEGVFELEDDSTDPNYGYETGIINFNVPADLAAGSDGKLNLAVAFEVGSNFTSVTYDTSTKITNGEEYDFAGLLAGTKTLKLENANGSREYTLKFVKNNTDTAITSFTATGKDSDGSNVIVVDGTVDGSNLTVELPSNADLNQDIELAFVGPKAFDSSNPTITVGSGSTENFGTDGKATVTLTGGYSAPLSVKVVAADTKTQKFYTLTITKASSAFNEPKVTSAKLTLNKGDEDEAEYVANISGTTITFTLPHSTVDADLKEDGVNTVYTFGKTSMTSLTKTALAGTPTFKDGSSVTVTTDNGTKVVYTVKYVRKAAETGKTISNFVLSTADNKNLMAYNGNENYTVTAADGKFKVTLPTAGSDLYPDFTLSTGAKLYSVATADKKFTEISAYNTKTGVKPGAALDPKDTATAVDFYIVADETLATVIENDKTNITFTDIENKYKSNYTKYEFDVTDKDETGNRLVSLSAKDDQITAKIVSGDKIELTVPYGYTGTAFYFDYTLSKGATLSVTDGSKTVNPVSGGKKTWANDKLGADNAADTNPDFKIVSADDGTYKLQAMTTADNYADVTKLTVSPQDGGADRDYTVSKITVLEANTEAVITSLKANNVAASISGKNITVNLPFGTNLGQVKLAITASKMATVDIPGYDVEDPDELYDLTKSLTINVTSEDGNVKNVYTLTAKIADQFSDVKPGAWYYDNVMAAVEAGIVSGLGNGTFNPEGNVTRRDFAIMVVKLLLNGQEPPEADTTPFSDVSSSDYALDYIAYCAENGIISGSDGMFRPGDYITRQEAASVMKNALELTGTTSELFTDDAKIASWAKANVYACKAAGIFNGDEKGNFNPTSTLTRAEAASIMVNALNK